MTVENELKSRIVPTPGNGQLHRTRLRFGSHLESDQGNLIPDLKARRLLLIASGNAAELVGVHAILAARAAKVNVHSR